MPDAHDAMVRQYRPLVWKIAGRYHADGHEPADGVELPALELITDTRADVPALVEHRDTLRAYAAVIRDRLTDNEREAIRLIVNGVPYARSKRLDNAAQKARRKLKEAA